MDIGRALWDISKSEAYKLKECNDKCTLILQLECTASCWIKTTIKCRQEYMIATYLDFYYLCYYAGTKLKNRAIIPLTTPNGKMRSVFPVDKNGPNWYRLWNMETRKRSRPRYGRSQMQQRTLTHGDSRTPSMDGLLSEKGIRYQGCML